MRKKTVQPASRQPQICRPIPYRTTARPVLPILADGHWCHDRVRSNCAGRRRRTFRFTDDAQARPIPAKKTV